MQCILWFCAYFVTLHWVSRFSLACLMSSPTSWETLILWLSCSWHPLYWRLTSPATLLESFSSPPNWIRREHHGPFIYDSSNHCKDQRLGQALMHAAAIDFLEWISILEPRKKKHEKNRWRMKLGRGWREQEESYKRHQWIYRMVHMANWSAM